MASGLPFRERNDRCSSGDMAHGMGVVEGCSWSASDLAVTALGEWVLWVFAALFVLKIFYNAAVGVRLFLAAREGRVIAASLAPVEAVFIPVIVVLSIVVDSGEWVAPWPLLLVIMILLAVGTHLLWGPLERLGGILADAAEPGSRRPAP